MYIVHLAGRLELHAIAKRLFSSDQNPGCLLYTGIILPSYYIRIISQYKDPYERISIMERHKGFERCSIERNCPLASWVHVETACER